MTRSTLLILAVSTALALCVSGNALAAKPVSKKPAATPATEIPAEPGQMQSAKLRSDSDDFSGSMTSASGAMSFRTTSLQASGKSAAVGSMPARIQARLEVNGAVIDHEIDYAAGTLTIRTADSAVIDAADRNLLKTFHTELGRKLSSQAGGMDNMPKSQDMLWRLAEMYSEVPLGYRLPANWVIQRDNKAVNTQTLMPGGSESDAYPLSAMKQTINQPALATAAACNEQSGGSFINLRSIADVCKKSPVLSRSSSHDYCPTHGYTSKTVSYGCGASSCAGRCGAGCGINNGTGAWYQDCLDHDVCNRDHNSQLGGCSDEWKEAADDYAFGTISCYGRCN